MGMNETETTTKTIIRVNFAADKWARNNAIAELKAAGATYDGTDKVWTLDETTIPNWVKADANKESMTGTQYVLYRATNFGRNTAAQVQS